MKKQNPYKFVVKNEKGKFPFGVYSNFERVIRLLPSIIFFISFFIVLMSEKLNHTQIIIFAVIGIILMLVLTFLTCLFNSFQIASMKMLKEANFSNYQKRVEKLINNKLHSETRIQIEIGLANYMFLKDMEKGIMMFEQINKPKSPSLRLLYDQINLVKHLNQNDFDGAKEIIQEIKNNYTNINTASLDNVLLVKSSETQIPNLESMFPTNTKHKLLNYINADTQLKHYVKFNDYENIKKYAKFIIDANTDFDQTNNEAKKYLEEV